MFTNCTYFENCYSMGIRMDRFMKNLNFCGPQRFTLKKIIANFVRKQILRNEEKIQFGLLKFVLRNYLSIPWFIDRRRKNENKNKVENFVVRENKNQNELLKRVMANILFLLFAMFFSTKWRILPSSHWFEYVGMCLSCFILRMWHSSQNWNFLWPLHPNSISI